MIYGILNYTLYICKLGWEKKYWDVNIEYIVFWLFFHSPKRMQKVPNFPHSWSELKSFQTVNLIWQTLQNNCFKSTGSRQLYKVTYIHSSAAEWCLTAALHTWLAHFLDIQEITAPIHVSWEANKVWDILYVWDIGPSLQWTLFMYCSIPCYIAISCVEIQSVKKQSNFTHVFL